MPDSKDAQIRQLRNVLAKAGRELLGYEPKRDGGRGQSRAFKIANFLGYKGNLTYEEVDAFLQSVYTEGPDETN